MGQPGLPLTGGVAGQEDRHQLWPGRGHAQCLGEAPGSAQARRGGAQRRAVTAEAERGRRRRRHPRQRAASVGSVQARQLQAASENLREREGQDPLDRTRRGPPRRHPPRTLFPLPHRRRRRLLLRGQDHRGCRSAHRSCGQRRGRQGLQTGLRPGPARVFHRLPPRRPREPRV